jgi:uncharacterized protein YhbP (UPF0306 family)
MMRGVDLADATSMNRRMESESMAKELGHKPRTQKRIDVIYAFLREQSTCVLSSSGAAGALHAAPLFYLPVENLDLFWLSSMSSRHSEDVAGHTDASVAIFAPTFAWKEIVGVQMEGTCSVVEGTERKPLLNAYSERFHLGTVFSIAIQQSTLYRFQPRWVRYTNNRKYFGYRIEINLEDASS